MNAHDIRPRGAPPESFVRAQCRPDVGAGATIAPPPAPDSGKRWEREPGPADRVGVVFAGGLRLEVSAISDSPRPHTHVAVFRQLAPDRAPFRFRLRSGDLRAFMRALDAARARLERQTSPLARVEGPRHGDAGAHGDGHPLLGRGRPNGPTGGG
jgi:hypothetical protein